MRFIHAADLHLDSPMAGLRARHGTLADDVSGATRTAFRRMIDVAIREKVDFVVIAGDVFDRDLTDFAPGLFFVSGLSDLGKAGIRVALIRGNHDATGRISRNLKWPANVYEFGSRAPSTHLLEDLGVAIHGQSFPDRAVTENLAAAYPPPKAGWFNIGLLHTSADGNYGHDTYAPCNLADLTGKGYDYWALGHVHQRRVLAENPWVVFPGNLQGRHVNEPGEKGFTLVSVEGGRVREVLPCPVESLRWVDLRIDVSRAESIEDALPAIAEAFAEASARADDRALAARLRLVGASPAHGALIAERERLEAECDSLAEQALGTILIEKILIETRPAAFPSDPALVRTDLAPLLRGVAEDAHETADLRLGLEDALRRLHPTLTSRDDVGLTHIGDDRFAKLLADAEALLAHRLGAGVRRR
jgi:DNA repair exonuclease SbcCD nuclease subunit